MRALRALVVVAVVSAGLVLPASVGAAVADAYEDDDTYASAVAVDSGLDTDGSSGWFGEPLFGQTRTFDFVDDDGATSDIDWVKFTVATADIESGYSYVFEAYANEPQVDPVLELYASSGPNGAASATDPAALGEVPGTGVTETDPVALVANDDGAWFERASSSLSFIPSAAGTYYVRVRPYYRVTGTPGYDGGDGSYTLRMKVGQISRVAGSDRIATAVAISRQRFASAGPAGGACIVASAYAFPDALAGSTLAGAVGGPVLLTSPTALSPAVSAEIVRLGVDKVYLLGGTGAVSPAVEAALDALSGVSVERVWGVDRIATARQVANRASTLASSAPVAFVVNAYSFPDALSASPMATYNVAPILLTQGTKLDPQARAALEDATLGITDVVIVGGTGVVSSAVFTEIAGILGGSAHVRRVSGSTRYETSRNFAIWATDRQTDPDTVGTTANPDALKSLDFARVGIASGEDFPDALAGGVFCGLARSPILLTRSRYVSSWICAWFGDPYYNAPAISPGQDYWFAADWAILRSFVFGGSGAVSDGVFQGLDVFSGPGF